MEKEIEERKKKKSFQHIDDLEKNLSTIKIYKKNGPKIQKKKEVFNKAFYYLRHNNKALKVQAQVNYATAKLKKTTHTGQSLAEILEKNEGNGGKEKNPFEKLIDIQDILDSADYELKESQRIEDEYNNSLLGKNKNKGGIKVKAKNL